MRRPGVLAASLLAFGLTVLVAAPSLHYEFVYDDEAVVLERKPFWDLGLAGFLRSRPFGTGRHLAAASIDLDRLEAGTSSARAFHRSNIAYAAMLSLLVLALALRLGMSPAAAAAAACVFAVHPVHVDSVAWIVGRAELLSALGVVAALLVAIRPSEAPAARHPWRVAIQTALLATAALHAKENALCLPLLLVAARVFLGARVALLPALVGSAVAIASLAVIVAPLVSTFKVPQLVDNPLVYAPAVERIPKALAILWQYAALLVWPHPLLPDRSWKQVDPGLVEGWLALAAWLLAAAVVWSLRARAPRVAFALAWFPLAFAISSNVLRPIGLLMAERLMLLPSVSVALLAGLWIDVAPAPARRRLALAAIAAVVAVFFVLFRARAEVWRDSDTYFAAAVAAAPLSAKAHYDYGAWTLRSNDRRLEGEAELEKALAIVPSLSRAANLLAESKAGRGDPAGGAEVYRAYLDTTPLDTGAIKNLTRLLLKARREGEAVRWAQRWVELAPGDRDALEALVIAEQAAKRAAGDAPPIQ